MDPIRKDSRKGVLFSMEKQCINRWVSRVLTFFVVVNINSMVYNAIDYAKIYP